MNLTSIVSAGAARALAAPATLVATTCVVLVRNDRQFLEATDGHVWAGGWPEAYRWAAPLLSRLVSDAGAGLVVLTVGLGLLLGRGPFLAPGRRWPGRGRAAIAAAGLGVACGAAGVASEAIADPNSTYVGWANPRFFSTSLQTCAGNPPAMVLGAWAVLALAGRWRGREDPTGHLGRLVGWAWLALLAFELVRATF